jgi:outer membrane protein OmpA-like peptidoglycan-associated protein
LSFEERGNKMIQKELNEENKGIKAKAYELYEQHGSKDGNDAVDWLEAEKQMREKSGPKSNNQMRNILLTIIGILCLIVVILLITLFKKNSEVRLSQQSLSDLKVMMLVLNPKADEKIVVFGDTHFDFGKSTLSQESKTLLDKDVQVLKDNPQTNVRMAGYTSAKGSEDVNQELSEKRANAVRDYLIEEGIAPERITVIGYGRTRPAVFEVTPGNMDSEEALANMRVLFEVVVK